MIAKTLCAAVVSLGISGLAYAHPGGLDSKGCHNDRKRGGYHCHRAQSDPEPTKQKQQKPSKADEQKQKSPQVQ